MEKGKKKTHNKIVKKVREDFFTCITNIMPSVTEICGITFKSIILYTNPNTVLGNKGYNTA